MVVDSKQKRLSPAQIMEIAAEETKSEFPIEVIKKTLEKEFALPSAWRLRVGNTIFIVHKSNKPRYGMFRALNADTAQNYIHNSRVFIQDAYEEGFDVIITQFSDPTILNIFKTIGRDKPPNTGYAVQRTSDGGYQVTLVLGVARGGDQ